MYQILVIDDDPIARMLLKQALQCQGYDVLEAQDGAEGLACAEKVRPALIVCDWQMPGMDGLEVCRQIKANPQFASTFFILLTNRNAIADIVAGLEIGADDFVGKPVQSSELTARVKAGLRLHQSLQELHTQKQILENELAEAVDYVKSTLPKPLKGEVKINSRFLPSQHLGGDCFDFYWLDSDFLVIYLLDVSGHGLGSALPSISVQNLLRSHALPQVSPYIPNSVLQALNETFQMTVQNPRYFTIWYGVYNRKKRQLFYASAGHPPAILVEPLADGTSQVKRLRTPGSPIGMMSDVQYPMQCCTIAPNSRLYVFSDGIYEIRQSNGKYWNLDGFVNLLTTEALPIDEILLAVQQQSEKPRFEDDCSLIQVQF